VLVDVFVCDMTAGVGRMWFDNFVVQDEFEVVVLALLGEPCVGVICTLVLVIPRWSVCLGVLCEHDYFMPPPAMRDDMWLMRVLSWLCMLAMQSFVSLCLQWRSLMPSRSDLTSTISF